MITEPAPQTVGVARLADYLRRKIDADRHLRNVSVRGEISNFKGVARNGNAYFDLKEGDALLNCFAFASDFVRFPKLENGAAIVAGGTVQTYAGRSSFQLVVRTVARDGFGELHVLFEERKRRLDAEGLFAIERKRALPAYPFRVALVSSRSANGAIDFTTILRKRSPHVGIVWCETSVQGAKAPLEIAAAIDRASRADVDAIVVTRGGGSFEDLFAFSDELVVRAIARSRVPVISAIGHAADQQLSDFVADVHAETPSKAAEALGVATDELRRRIAEQTRRAARATEHRVERLRASFERTASRAKLDLPALYLVPYVQRLDALVRRLDRQAPTKRLAERERRLIAAIARLGTAASARLAERDRTLAGVVRKLDAVRDKSRSDGARRLERLTTKLDGNDPEAILQRGYAIVTSGDQIVRDATEVAADGRIDVRLARGTLTARVESARGRTEKGDGDDRNG